MSAQHDQRPFHLMGTTAATGPATPAGNLRDRLEEAMRVLAEFHAAEPIGQWMRSEGCPPEEWVVFLPSEMRRQVGPCPPSYVRFSNHIPGPVIVKARALFPLMTVGA